MISLNKFEIDWLFCFGKGVSLAGTKMRLRALNGKINRAGESQSDCKDHM